MYILRVGSHLIYWGFDAATVHELDWWQSKTTGKQHYHYGNVGLTLFGQRF